MRHKNIQTNLHPSHSSQAVKQTVNKHLSLKGKFPESLPRALYFRHPSSFNKKFLSRHSQYTLWLFSSPQVFNKCHSRRIFLVNIFLPFLFILLVSGKLFQEFSLRWEKRFVASFGNLFTLQHSRVWKLINFRVKIILNA